MLHLPEKALVIEVGPRDGLQSLARTIDTETKVRMVDRLSAAGLPVIEVTGFAHPRVIPQLADAEAVLERITRRPGTIYRGLVPNARGAERAAGRVDEMLGLITVSEAYLAKNQNMTRAQAVAEAIKAFAVAESCGARFVMALGMSMWCPYEGPIAPERTVSLLEEFHAAGMRRFYLAGSLGMEDPRQVNALFRQVRERFADIEVGYHVHNLSGCGTANVLAALDGGATFIEGAIAGLGGGIMMPTTMGAVGNLATEDIVALLSSMGIETGVKPADVASAARDVAAMLEIEPRSFATAVGGRADVMAAAKANPRAHPA
ncbi:MAG: hydroxymethylglutaryl-CoA lyase [Hyphomicrobiaceae bacterium]